MAFNFNDPMQFMQMLFSPEMNPQMMDQMAGQLAMKMQPPQIPMGAPGQGMMGLTPGPEMALGRAPIPQMGLPPGLGPIPGLNPGQGPIPGQGLMPGESMGMPGSGLFPQPPGAAQLPPGTVMSGADTTGLGDVMAQQDMLRQKQMLGAALTAQQMAQYQKMLEPSTGPVIAPPSPPGGRQIGAMQQLQMPQGPAMPMSLAALLGGRR